MASTPRRGRLYRQPTSIPPGTPLSPGTLYGCSGDLLEAYEGCTARGDLPPNIFTQRGPVFIARGPGGVAGAGRNGTSGSMSIVKASPLPGIPSGTINPADLSRTPNAGGDQDRPPLGAYGLGFVTTIVESGTQEQTSVPTQGGGLNASATQQRQSVPSGDGSRLCSENQYHRYNHLQQQRDQRQQRQQQVSRAVSRLQRQGAVVQDIFNARPNILIPDNIPRDPSSVVVVVVAATPVASNRGNTTPYSRQASAPTDGICHVCGLGMPTWPEDSYRNGPPRALDNQGTSTDITSHHPWPTARQRDRAKPPPEAKPSALAELAPCPPVAEQHRTEPVLQPCVSYNPAAVTPQEERRRTIQGQQLPESEPEPEPPRRPIGGRVIAQPLPPAPTPGGSGSSPPPPDLAALAGPMMVDWGYDPQSSPYGDQTEVMIDAYYAHHRAG